MKLSEAMMLGSTTCRMIPGDINSCALGCAANAVGIKRAETFNYGCFRSRYEEIQQKWPWLKEKTGIMDDIWIKFDCQVCRGNLTFEQLVDYVKSIEPECGECNRFECECNENKIQEVVSEQIVSCV